MTRSSLCECLSSRLDKGGILPKRGRECALDFSPFLLDNLKFKDTEEMLSTMFPALIASRATGGAVTSPLPYKQVLHTLGHYSVTIESRNRKK